MNNHQKTTSSIWHNLNPALALLGQSLTQSLIQQKLNFCEKHITVNRVWPTEANRPNLCKGLLKNDK